jgi:hypothetical protein
MKGWRLIVVNAICCVSVDRLSMSRSFGELGVTLPVYNCIKSVVAFNEHEIELGTFIQGFNSER